MSYLHGANWKQTQKTLEKLGAPTNAKELHVDDENLAKALEIAATLRPDRYTILNKLNLNHDSCEKIAKATQVI